MERINRSQMLDRESPIPIYHQIASDIIDRISLGEWEIGDQLPSTAVLLSEYNVSPLTLRAALKCLEDEQLIFKQQGKGTFLRNTPKPFVEELSLPGTKPKNGNSFTTSKIVEWKLDEEPCLHLRQTFNLNGFAPTIFLRRLFYRNDKLIGLNDVWFPRDMLSDLMEKGLLNGSITSTLEQRYGYKIVNVENYIESAKLNANEAALLDVPLDSPVLRISSAHYIEGGRIIECSCTSWMGNLTRFHFNVTAK